MKRFYSKISGTGFYVPERIVGNDYFEGYLDTSDEWIKTMTGISERRYIDEKMATSDMALAASKMAIKNAGLKPSDIQLIIVATITPDHPFPSTACLLQEKLEIKHIPAFDVSAACTGFIYASDIARQYIENGVYENILVIGAETLTRITNMNDRNTCVLFGDGAGAVVYSLAHEADIEKFIDSHIEADGSKWKLLQQKAGGSCLPSSKQTVEENLHTIYMEGNKIFKFATKTMVNTCNVLIKRNELELNDINWLIPHQANSRIIQSVGKKLKIDPTKVIVNIQKYGNTSSATIPIALAEAIEMQIIRKRDLVLVTAFGGGLTAGSMLIRI